MSENTYVMPSENAAEMARLIDQDKLVTEAMGGLFPLDLDLNGVQAVLDVGCGPGGWAREVAYQYPQIQVTGIDISQTMIDYANGFVRVEGLDNARFQVMDATHPLAFPDGSFDVVNARFMVGFLRRSAWPGVVKEFARVSRPGGRIILTECDQTGTTNSEAYHAYTGLAYEAMRRSGLYAGSLSLTPLLGSFLREAGAEQIQLRPHVLDFSAGTTANVAMYENLKVGFKLGQAFGVKMGVATQEELDALYERVLADMLSDTFRALWYFLSVDGRLPLR
jgi:ubiquinone/menaquinone biosynthesis C-methylase UbiE